MVVRVNVKYVNELYNISLTKIISQHIVCMICATFLITPMIKSEWNEFCELLRPNQWSHLNKQINIHIM